MTDTTAPDAITQAEAVDWRSPIVVVGLGGEAPARVVAGPDAEGHYRVNFKQDFWRGLHWFRADGQAVGNTGNIVRNALVPADAHRRLAAHGAAEGLREALERLERRPVHDGYDDGGDYVWVDYIRWEDVRDLIAATPPTDAGSTKGEVATFLAALADGSLVRETLAAGAIIDVMTGGKFDWRARINDSNFTSSADWMTALAYARAALDVSALTDAGSTTREGEQEHSVDALAAGQSVAQLLGDVLLTLRHARTFIVSRERMHPDGVSLYDAEIAKVEASVACFKRENVHG